MNIGVEIVYSLTNQADYIGMNIGSWIIYNRSLSDAEFNQTMQFMLKKYVEVDSEFAFASDPCGPPA